MPDEAFDQVDFGAKVEARRAARRPQDATSTALLTLIQKVGVIEGWRQGITGQNGIHYDGQNFRLDKDVGGDAAGEVAVTLCFDGIPTTFFLNGRKGGVATDV